MIHSIKVMHIEAKIVYVDKLNICNIKIINSKSEKPEFVISNKNDMIILDKLFFKIEHWLKAEDENNKVEHKAKEKVCGLMTKDRFE